MHHDRTLLKAIKTHLGVNGQPTEPLLVPIISTYSFIEQRIITKPFLNSVPLPSKLSSQVLSTSWHALATKETNSIPLASRAQERNPEWLRDPHYHCLEFMNTAVLGLIIDQTVDFSPGLRSGVSQLMLPHFFRLIRNNLQQNFQLDKITEEEVFLNRFVEIVGQFLLPYQLSVLQQPVKPACQDLVPGGQLSCKLSAEEKLTITFTQVLSSSSDLKNYQISTLKGFVQEELDYWHHLWQTRKALRIYKVVQNLDDKLEHLQSTAKELLNLASTLQEGFQKLNAPKKIQLENEFYKETTGWHIRFKGENIRLKKENNKGLFYIHKLVSYPNEPFYPNQLEGEIPSKNKDAVNVTLFETYQQTGVDIKPYRSIIDDEKELKVNLKRLLEESKAEDSYSDTRSLEDHIYHLAEVLFIINALINNRTRKEYVLLHKQKKEEFEEACFMLRRKEPAPFFLQQIIKKSKVISKPIEWDKNNRRVRQRVSRNIKNSIKALDSAELRAYFQETLTLGSICKFTPKKENPIRWHLTID